MQWGIKECIYIWNILYIYIVYIIQFSWKGEKWETGQKSEYPYGKCIYIYE